MAARQTVIPVNSYGNPALSIVGSGISANGDWTNCSQIGVLTATFVLTISATLTSAASTLFFRGTNSPNLEATGSNVLKNVVETCPGTGWAAGFSMSNGVLTMAAGTTGAGTYSVNMRVLDLYQFVRPEFTFGGGGGTFSAKVYFSGWSV